MADRHDWAGLQATDIDAQERAALALYDSAQLDTVLADDRAAAALQASVSRGNHSAAAILLLGHVASADAQALLWQLNSEEKERTKLRAWLRPVPVRLAAMVALSRAGDSKARLALLAHMEDAPIDELVFLLAIVREVDDPVILHLLARHLTDERPVTEGLPSGAQPQRRLADLTADALIDRLNLPVSFARRPGGRYSSQELREVQRLLRDSVPQ